jgi:hypothetical protein
MTFERENRTLIDVWHRFALRFDVEAAAVKLGLTIGSWIAALWLLAFFFGGQFLILAIIFTFVVPFCVIALPIAALIDLGASLVWWEKQFATTALAAGLLLPPLTCWIVMMGIAKI